MAFPVPDPPQEVRPTLVLVAAIAQNGVIGRDNALPWRLKSDLRHFRQLTFGKPVVMGRKTYLSIGRPLPGRTTIVVSRETGFAVTGALVANSLAAALEAARGDMLRRGTDEIAVIGGADIYAQWMGDADRLEVTEVHERPDGDTHFAPIDQTVWQEVARTRHAASADDSADFSYVTYRRR